MRDWWRDGHLPKWLIEVKELQPKFPSFWQMASVNVQPWLCCTLPPLPIFPPHSLFLIMFSRSVEPELITLRFCMSTGKGISGGGISTVSAVLSRIQNKSLVWCGLLLNLQNNAFHCDPARALNSHYIHYWRRCCGVYPSIMNQCRQIGFTLSLRQRHAGTVCLVYFCINISFGCLHCHCSGLFISAWWADTWATVWQTVRPTISCNCQRISHPKCIRSFCCFHAKGRPGAIGWKTWPKSVFT